MFFTYTRYEGRCPGDSHEAEADELAFEYPRFWLDSTFHDSIIEKWVL